MSGGSLPLWRAETPAAEIVCVGRAGGADRGEVLARATGRKLAVAWPRQTHSATVLEADRGPCGDGDALVTDRPELALAVVTADCVPLLLAADGAVAAVHAGWRGIVAGIVPAAVERLAARAASSPTRLQAWLGPAIGPCCYEVGDDVAARVVAASHEAALAPGRRSRPHLDLHRAVITQLLAAGVRRGLRWAACTHCAGQLLHSYRRDGPTAGRNHAFIWLRRAGGDVVPTG